MRARDLYRLLSSAEGGASLREAIALAIPAYQQELAESGRAASIVMECDADLLPIAAMHLMVLCEAFLAEQINAVELGYIATAIDLVPDFHCVSKMTEEVTHLLSTKEPNPEAVTAVLRILREHAA